MHTENSSCFHPCFLALTKVLILVAHILIVILKSFKSEVSVLNTVQVVLMLLESNPRAAVRVNCSV